MNSTFLNNFYSLGHLLTIKMNSTFINNFYSPAGSHIEKGIRCTAKVTEVVHNNLRGCFNNGEGWFKCFMKRWIPHHEANIRIHMILWNKVWRCYSTRKTFNETFWPSIVTSPFTLYFRVFSWKKNLSEHHLQDKKTNFTLTKWWETMIIRI